MDPAAVAAQFEAARAREQALVRETVADPDRMTTIVGLIDERDRIVSAYAERVRRYVEDARRLNGNYDARIEDFEVLVSEFRDARQSYQEAMVRIVDRMKDATSDAEWKRLAAFQLKELNPRSMTQPAGGI
ncbi:MAG: hypothetical protein V2I63_08145 [Pseudomonadales bacterium]|nr:hypothetical protein [Pseudomonadales bacterium]